MIKISLPLALLCSALSYAQVGVNNTDPKATLDITAKTTDASKPEGLIAPRLTGDEIRGKNAQYDIAQTGAIIYATTADSSPSGKTANITASGYYYFDGGTWQKINTGVGSGTGDTTNDAWINDNANSMVKLGTQSDGSTPRPAGTGVVVKNSGYIGIGTETPNFPLTINPGNAQFPFGLGIYESSHATSRRAAMQIGANWLLLQDINGNGTRNFSIYNAAGSGNNIFNISETNNIGIGTVSPASNAIVEMAATNKGFLPPRLALTGNNDVATVPSPSAGMIVYNTTTSTTLNKGITFYDGTEWKQLVPAIAANSSAVVDLQSNATTGNSTASSTSGATYLNFGTITAPSDGSYAFSFRLYGKTSDDGRGIFYIYLVKVHSDVETILDLAELNPNCYNANIDAITYSVTLSGGGVKQGDTFKVYMGRYNGGGATSPTWTLAGNPGQNANKTSFTWWRL